LKSCCILQDHYDDQHDKIAFHNTTPDLQDQDQDHNMQDQGRAKLLSASMKRCSASLLNA